MAGVDREGRRVEQEVEVGKDGTVTMEEVEVRLCGASVDALYARPAVSLCDNASGFSVPTIYFGEARKACNSVQAGITQP